MKTFTSAYQTELNKNVTTLAGCLKITRVDNTVYLYTNHDKDIVVNTGNSYDGTYLATSSFTPTAFTFTSDLAVDNFDITNIIDNIAISEIDIINDLFANAKVWYFSVNYNTPTGEITVTDGIDKVFYGFIGQISFTENKYTAEIRSLSTKLTKYTGDVFSKTCRTTLGSTKCGIQLDFPEWTVDTVYSVGDIVKATTYDGRIYECTTAGTSDPSTEPTWDTTINNITNDLAPLVWTTKDSLTKEFGVHEYIKYIRVHVTEQFQNQIYFPEIEGYDYSGTNVFNTLGTATSPQGAFAAPSNAIDGNTGTYWRPNANAPVRLDIELSTASEIEKYRIYMYSVHTQGIKSWYMEVSSDGTNWKTVHSVTNSTYADGAWTPYFFLNPTGYISNKAIIPFQHADNLIVADNFLNNGMLTFTSGLATGEKAEIKKSGIYNIELLIPINRNIARGDTFTAVVGCNRHFLGSDGTIATGDCITKFNNGVNFRGEPYIPSDDILVGGNGPIERDE